MNMKKIISACMALLVVSLTACNDFLDEPMKGNLNTESIYSSPEEAQLAVNGIYNASTYFINLWRFGDVASDDAVKGGNEGDIEFYQSYILPAYVNGNDEEMQRNNAVRSYFGLPVVDKANAGGADADPNTNSYMLITLKVSTANLINTENKGNKLVPQEIFITAQIRLESGNSEKDTRIFVNTLSDEECEIMNRILKSAGYDKTLFGDENVNPGEETSTQKLISNIFDSELVNYTYTIDLPGMGQYTHTFVITVRDVISESYVWYCSLYDGNTDDRRPYILSEAAKSFNNVGDPRYGIAYLRFEKSESLDLLN